MRSNSWDYIMKKGTPQAQDKEGANKEHKVERDRAKGTNRIM